MIIKFYDKKQDCLRTVTDVVRIRNAWELGGRAKIWDMIIRVDDGSDRGYHLEKQSLRQRDFDIFDTVDDVVPDSRIDSEYVSKFTWEV